MATEILSIGSDASAEFTVAAGDLATLIMRGSGNASVRMKASDGSYVPFGELDNYNRVKTLDAPGVFIVTRLNGDAVEVDKEG